MYESNDLYPHVRVKGKAVIELPKTNTASITAKTEFTAISLFFAVYSQIN